MRGNAWSLLRFTIADRKVASFGQYYPREVARPTHIASLPHVNDYSVLEANGPKPRKRPTTWADLADSACGEHRQAAHER